MLARFPVQHPGLFLANCFLSALVLITAAYAIWLALDTDIADLPPINKVAVQSTQTLPLDVGADWQKITLPGRTCKVTPQPCFDVYRTKFTNQSQERLAVFVPRFAGSARVILNGIHLDDFGAPLESPRDLHFHPGFTRLPVSLLRADENILDIIVTNEADRYHFLNPFFIGPHDALKLAYNLHRFMATDVPKISIGVFVMLGVLSFVVFNFGGRDPVYGLFFCIVCFAAMRSWYFADPFIEPPLFRAATYFVGSIGTLTSIYLFARRLIRPHATFASDIRLLIVGLIGASIITLGDVYAPVHGSFVSNTAVRLSALVIGCLTVGLLLRYFRTEFSLAKLWSLILFGLAFALIVHDTTPIVVGQMISMQLSNLSPLFVVLAFCMIAGHQFSSALRVQRNYTRELRAEVSAAKQELASAYEELASARANEAVLSERSRIMREVHDGVGGKLAGILYMARRLESSDKTDDRAANIVMHAEESLLDLRAIIDALDETHAQDLALALQKFQKKLVPWLVQYELQAKVETTDIPSGIAVQPTWLLALYRILQESLSNVLKHAGASRVDITAVASNSRLTVTVQDNGVGYKGQSYGRGLNNIEHRCKEIGGTSQITGTECGTSVRVQLPILNPIRQEPAT